MNKHLIELHAIYSNELSKVKERVELHREYVYLAMKEYVNAYEKEMDIKEKIEEIERDIAIHNMSLNPNDEYDNDR